MPRRHRVAPDPAFGRRALARTGGAGPMPADPQNRRSRDEDAQTLPGGRGEPAERVGRPR
jgi:hypothetical protein